MANLDDFKLTDEIFSDPGLRAMLTQDEVDLINSSPLLKSLLHEYYSEEHQTITHDLSADSSGYQPDSAQINIKQTGRDFVRVLGHELTHYFDHRIKLSMAEGRDNLNSYNKCTASTWWLVRGAQQC